MQPPTPEAAAREAVRHWHRVHDLAAFAARRHGFGDTDGGFGVTYPGDLDDFDRTAGERDIPIGFVRVYGYWGPPDGYEVVASEGVYLATLADVLAGAGYEAEAEQVRGQRITVAR